jgi:hypothetical protein
VVERPSQPAWQPSARVAQPAPGAPAQPGRAPKPAKAKGSRWGLWLGLGGIVAAAVCAVAVLGGGALVVTTSGTSTAEAMALASAQASGTAEAERLQATSAAATALADEATALAVIVQNATGTAQAAPTALPTIVSAAAWPVVLTDEFAANDNGWHPFDTFEDDYGTRRFLLSRGRYNWEVTPLKDIHLHDTPNMASMSDFLISVDARQTSGPASADYGLAFRVVSDNTLYTFNISDTGQFAVQLLYQGQWTTLVNWTPTAAVRPGESNNLKVLAVGDQFTFFVNDQEVARLGDDSVPQGRVGVAVDHFEEGVTASWEFDDFELRAP